MSLSYDPKPVGKRHTYLPPKPRKARKPAPAPKPAKAPKPPAKRAVLPPPYPGYLSPQDQYSSARSQAQQILQAQIDAYNSSRGQITGQASAFAGQEQDAAQAYAKLLGQFAPQIQGIYNQATQQTQGLASGYSQAVQGILNQGSTENQALLAGQGQPATPASPNTAVGDVLYGTGGSLPGQSLQQAGAGFASAAAMLPATALLQGFKYQNQRYQDADQQLRDLQQQISQVQGTYPKEYYAALNDIQGQQADLSSADLKRQQAAFDRQYKQQQADLNRQYKNAQITLSQQRLTQSGQVAADRSNQGWARLSQQARKDAANNVYKDKNYQLSVQRLSLAQKTAAAKQQAKLDGGGYTKSALIQLQKRAGQIAGKAFDGVSTTQTVDGKKVTGTIHLSYQEAMQRGLSQHIPLSVMQAALNAYWPAPGASQPWEHIGNDPAKPLKPGGGRPLQSYQQRHPATGTAQNTALGTNPTPIQVIRAYAPRFGLDPAAVLAYALTQGGTSWGAVGDNGSSFGPFQAHRGGALGSHDEAWANSPQGLMELMGMMSRAGAKGMSGPDAAAYIVGPAFGRGSNPARDIRNARAQYKRALALLGGKSV